MKSELAEKVMDLLARELNVDASELSPRKLLREDLGMDSIIALNVMFTAERELGVTLREEDVVEVRTVADLLVLVEKLDTYTP